MSSLKFRLLLLVLALGALACCKARDEVRDDWDLFRREQPFFGAFLEKDERYLWKLRPGTYALKDLPDLGDVEIERARRGEFDNLPPLEINDGGFRGEEPRKRRPTLRVICLGDSVTFGYQHPYPEFLQQKLNNEAGIDAEVINAGVPGYSIVQGRKWLEEDLGRLRPDVIVVFFGWNDAKDRLRDSTDRQLLASAWKRFWATWLPSWMPGAETPKSADAGALEAQSGCCRVLPERFGEQLGLLSGWAASHGARLYQVTYPTALAFGEFAGAYPEWLVRERLARLGAIRAESNRLGIPTIALAETVAERGAAAYFRDAAHDPVHPGEEGAALIAGVVTQALLQTSQEH